MLRKSQPFQRTTHKDSKISFPCGERNLKSRCVKVSNFGNNISCEGERFGKKSSKGTGQKHSWDLLLNTKIPPGQEDPDCKLLGAGKVLWRTFTLCSSHSSQASAVGHQWRNATEVAKLDLCSEPIKLFYLLNLWLGGDL